MAPRGHRPRPRAGTTAARAAADARRRAPARTGEPISSRAAPLADGRRRRRRRGLAGSRRPSRPRTARKRPKEAFGLSRREREVLALIAEGRTNREIGERLFISQKTVGVHVGNILAKLGASGRVEAAMVAIRLELVPTPLAGARLAAT